MEIDWVDVGTGIVARSIEEIREALAVGREMEAVRRAEDGHLVRGVDLIAERICLSAFRKLGKPFVMVSEESGIVHHGGNAKIAVLLDPLDGTECAIRGIPLYSVSLSVHEYDSMETVFATVGDPVTNNIYHASPEGAYLNQRRIRPSSVTRLEDAFIVTYAAKTDRLTALSTKRTLVTRAGLILNYGGPLTIAQVGSGAVDAFVEFSKGFRSIDFGAGSFIAKKAGAIVTNLEGSPPKIYPDLTHRSTLVIAGTQELHKEVLEALKD